MKHFVFLFYIISFLVGFLAIFLAIDSYSKNKNAIVKYYIYMSLSFTFILLEQTITTYKLVNIFDNVVLSCILRIISTMGCGFLIYTLPLFIHNVNNTAFTEKKRSFFGVLGCIPVASILVFYTTSYKNIIISVNNAILFTVMAYCIWQGLIRQSKEESAKIRGRKGLLLLFVIILFTYMFMDSKSNQIPWISEHFSYGLLSVPAVYLILNLSCLYFGKKYFARCEQQKESIQHGTDESLDEAGAIEEFYNKYKITNREKQVIELLMKAYSYRSISMELVISLTTAKTHIYNIYQKTGVKNKVELINKIKSLDRLNMNSTSL